MLPLPQLDFRRTPVTLIIAAVAVAIEVVCVFNADKRDFFYNDLGLGILSLVWSFQWWRPFTTTLLHGGPIHLAFNVYWLVVFGGVLEPRVGSYRFLGLLVLLGTVSSMVQFLVTDFYSPLDGQRGCVGLSGIMYGLFGLLWMARRWHPEFRLVLSDGVVKLMVAWFFLCILLTYARIMGVANIAHGTGAAFGVLYGLALYHPQQRLPWTVASVAATLLVLATMVACPGHPLYEKHRQKQEDLRIFQMQGGLEQGEDAGR